MFALLPSLFSFLSGVFFVLLSSNLAVSPVAEIDDQ
jgi:hypothetical protein